MVGTRLVRWIFACVLAVSLSAGAVGCAGGSSGTGAAGGAALPSGTGAGGVAGLPASSDPKLDAGRQIIETKCKMCHTLDRVKTATHDSATWESTIARMQLHGLVVTDQEVKQILDYLASR